MSTKGADESSTGEPAAPDVDYDVPFVPVVMAGSPFRVGRRGP